MIHTAGSAWRLSRRGMTLRSVDLLSRSEVAEALQGCTHVVNLSRGSDDVMIGGLENLLSAANKQRVRRFVHISSVAVYGDPPPPESAREDSSAHPAPGSYGALKLQQDRLVERAHAGGLSSAILCPPNITGLYSTFVCNVIEDMRRGRLALVEDGQLPINVVDVENLCHAIMLALMADSVDGRRIVTDGPGITWRHFTDELLPLAELAAPLPSVPRSEIALPATLHRRFPFDGREASRVIRCPSGASHRPGLRCGGRNDARARRQIARAVSRHVARPDRRAQTDREGCQRCPPRFRYNPQQLRGVTHSTPAPLAL